MATLGVNDLKQYALPTNWDASLLTQLSLRDGTTYETLINDIAAAMALQNADLVGNPLIGGMIFTTAEVEVEYRIGVSNGFKAHTEYSRPDEGRGATTGHMTPLGAFDRGLGWTYDFLRKARRAQIDADISSVMDDIRNIFAKQALTALFTSTKVAVGSGYSMPVADGGTADSSYVPVANPDRASAFTYTHNHVQALEGIKQAHVETVATHLWEHGHDGPYDLLVSSADISSWTDVTSVTGYVPRAKEGVNYGTTADLATVAGDYVGVVTTNRGSAYLRSTGRIPTGYWTMYKSYGQDDQRNILRCRYDDMIGGVGAYLLAGDHIRRYPLESALIRMDFGFGIGSDRTVAVIVKNTDGSWSDPTIS
jgi:hypothetical protein